MDGIAGEAPALRKSREMVVKKTKDPEAAIVDLSNMLEPTRYHDIIFRSIAIHILRSRSSLRRTSGFVSGVNKMPSLTFTLSVSHVALRRS